MRAASLLLSPNSLAALSPSTLISQLEGLLINHRIDHATEFVDRHRRKLEANLTIDPDDADELAYMYQVIGFKCFSETLFESAGGHLFNGSLDPRVLVSYYPDLQGSLFAPEDHVDVFSGVVEHMPPEKSVDDLIAMNLVRNYSPHLPPNTQKALPAVELNKALSRNAREMLLDFLAKSRNRAIVERRAEDVRIGVARVVDTVLAKLYADFNRSQDLRTLLSAPNHVVLSEIEPSLRTLGLYHPLASLYKRYGDDEKLLKLYASIVEGEYTDPEIPYPLGDMVALLESRKTKDRSQQVRWGLWMLKRGDVDRGMKLLIPPETGKSRIRDRDKEEDLALLDQITEANDDAGRRFLEYLVLTKRNTSPDLHTRLALSCIDDLLRCIKDEPTHKLWRAKASSYASTRPPTATFSHSPSSTQPSSKLTTQTQASFLSYFASTTPDSPSKRTRLKVVLLLAGSGSYDAGRIKARLYEGLGLPTTTTTTTTPNDTSPSPTLSQQQRTRLTNLLALESAILDGKLGDHSAALSTLVHDLRDSTSAEAYCILGGEVVPAKAALAIVESERGRGPGPGPGPESESVEVRLEDWYWGLFEPPMGSSSKKGGKEWGGKVGAGAPALVRQKSVREEVKRSLLMNLVEVYMSDEMIGMDRATKLLDAQGVNLDVPEVARSVPPQWPVSSLSTFLARYFRRMLHARYENQFVKNISAGQNLAVRDDAHGILREHGYLLEEPDSDAEGEKGGGIVATVVEEKVAELSEIPTSPPSLPPPGDEEKSELGLIMSEEESEGEESLT